MKSKILLTFLLFRKLGLYLIPLLISIVFFSVYKYIGNGEQNSFKNVKPISINNIDNEEKYKVVKYVSNWGVDTTFNDTTMEIASIEELDQPKYEIGRHTVFKFENNPDINIIFLAFSVIFLIVFLYILRTGISDGDVKERYEDCLVEYVKLSMSDKIDVDNQSGHRCINIFKNKYIVPIFGIGALFSKEDCLKIYKNYKSYDIWEGTKYEVRIKNIDKVLKS